MTMFKQTLGACFLLVMMIAPVMVGHQNDANAAESPQKSAVERVASAGSALPDFAQRRNRALEMLKLLTDTQDPQALANQIEAENGALGSFALDFALGDIWSREGLSRRDRSLIALTSLATLQFTDQFRYYIPMALKSGLTPTEIREIFPQLAVYAGFPKAFAAMAAANQELSKLGHRPEGGKLTPAEKFTNPERRERGAAVVARFTGKTELVNPRQGLTDLVDGSLGLMNGYALDYAFGDVWARPELSRRDRSFVVVSILTVLGRSEELKIHIPVAGQHGVTKSELEELVLTAWVYGGAPIAVEAMLLVQRLAK